MTNPRRPDQESDPPPMVVAPGGAAGTFRGRYVIIFGTGKNSGLFVYSPIPATGNLVASIAAAAGTDPYGNAYLAGICDYSGTLYAQLLGAAFNAGLTTSYAPGFMAAVGSNPGQLQISSPLRSVTDAALVLNLLSSAQNSGYGPLLSVTSGAFQSISGTASNPSLITTDSPHGLGSLGVSNLTISVANYVLTASGRTFLSIKGHVTGSVTAGAKAFPNGLPANQTPSTQTILAGGVTNGGSGIVGQALVSVSTGGGVTLLYPTMASGDELGVQAEFDTQ